jgi:hypothetical protein
LYISSYLKFTLSLKLGPYDHAKKEDSSISEYVTLLNTFEIGYKKVSVAKH